MRVINMRTGESARTVFSEEEARLALAEAIDLPICEAAFNPGLRGYHNGRYGALRHTVGDAVDESVLLRAVLMALGGPVQHECDHSVLEWFTASNPLDWPVAPSELRRDAALADASIAELAAHLNRTLRAEAARVLAACADYRCDGDTVGERVCADFSGVGFDDFAAALVSSERCWTALCAWTPTGGACGDPYTVCRYAWGPVRFAVKLEPHELLRAHLAGHADLTLYRCVIYDGSARREIIWAAERFSCCGRDWAADDQIPCWVDRRDGTLTRLLPWDDRIPYWVDRRFGVRTRLRPRDVQCKLCGAGGAYAWLTCRPVDDAAEPFGDIERLDALPVASLADATDWLHAIVGIPPQRAKPEESPRWRSAI